jgi:alpha-D-xyloside xylohydrolase
MLLDHWRNALAWEMDLQYYWGDHLIVAPSFSSGDTILEVWLPPGAGWYDYWSGEEYKGDKLIDIEAKPGFIPLFVRKGAIIPRHPYVQSTAFMEDTLLILDVYTGESGSFVLFEDDGISERYRTKAELRRTHIEYHENKREILIHPSQGSYPGASAKRKYLINFMGLENARSVMVNNLPLPATTGEEHLPGMYWDAETKILEIHTGNHPVNQPVKITLEY